MNTTYVKVNFFLKFCIKKLVLIKKYNFLIIHVSERKDMQKRDFLGAGLAKLMWNLNAGRYLYHILYTSWHQVFAQMWSRSGLVLYFGNELRYSLLNYKNTCCFVILVYFIVTIVYAVCTCSGINLNGKASSFIYVFNHMCAVNSFWDLHFYRTSNRWNYPQGRGQSGKGKGIIWKCGFV